MDNGKEFASCDFELLAARYEMIIEKRPPAKPRFGSVIERMFGTINTQLLYQLWGNTQATKKDTRTVTKSSDPANLACWTLAEFDRHLSEYLYRVPKLDSATCCEGGGPTGPVDWWRGWPASGGCCGGYVPPIAGASPPIIGGGNSPVIAGMPAWSVTEPRLNVWFQDVPVWYQPGRGPRLEFKLTYKDRQIATNVNNYFGFGPRWNGNFCSYAITNTRPTFGNGNIVVHHGDGTTVVYTIAEKNFYSQAMAEVISGGGYRLTLPSGVVQEFTTPISDGAYTRYLLTKLSYLTNSTLDDLSFTYVQTNGTVRLDHITDGAAKRTTFSYTNAGIYSALIASIATPGGQSAAFSYDANGWLTSITDAAGNDSSLVYEGTNGIRQLITPYGTTTFTFTNAGSWEMLRVNEFGLRNHLFLYLQQDESNRIPTGYTNEVPDVYDVDTDYGLTTTFETNNLHTRNSFYWGPRLYDRLGDNAKTNLNNGTFDQSQLTATDLLRARLRHWLLKRGTTTTEPSHTISLERGPSADGSTAGPLTWYDYDKTGGENNREGNQKRPKVVAAN